MYRLYKPINQLYFKEIPLYYISYVGYAVFILPNIQYNITFQHSHLALEDIISPKF